VKIHVTFLAWKKLRRESPEQRNTIKKTESLFEKNVGAHPTAEIEKDKESHTERDYRVRLKRKGKNIKKRTRAGTYLVWVKRKVIRADGNTKAQTDGTGHGDIMLKGFSHKKGVRSTNLAKKEGSRGVVWVGNSQRHIKALT